MKIWLTLALVAGASTAQGQCPSLLLVSGYSSDNVHLYDGCDGSHVGNLDDAGRLRGAQASRIGPDGRLYVVAEELESIARYDARTLEFIDIPVVLPPGFGATGIVFRGNEIWVSGYNVDLVRRYSLETGQALGDAVGAGAAGLRGADNGMVFGPDGQLYVPGFDSHNVVRHDPATGVTIPFIAPRSGGLFRTRGILFEPDGRHLLISSEGNGKILRFRADGSFVAEVISGLPTPTGLAYHADGSLLVAHATGVDRYDAASFAPLGLFARASAASAAGITFVGVLPVEPSGGNVVDPTQVGSQYWLAGAGPFSDNVVTIQDMVSSVGAAFGADFDPAEVQNKRWGSARIVFTSCTEGQFSWDATGADSAGFGAGSYPIRRLLDTAASQRCLAQGFDNADPDWVTGGWYGGDSRNGEGLMLDLHAGSTVFLTWFTYRPR